MYEKVITIHDLTQEFILFWATITNCSTKHTPDIYVGENIFKRLEIPIHPSKGNTKILFQSIYLELSPILKPEMHKPVTDKGTAFIEFRNCLELFLKQGGDFKRLFQHVENLFGNNIITCENYLK
ncbi:MAG: hypothetical protein ACRCTQ_05905 [Brevinemataceae bacterium]